MAHSLDEQGMRERCAKNSQKQKKKDISIIQSRFQDKKEREQEYCRPKILIKSNQKAGILLRKPPVKDGENGKSESGQQSPKNTSIGGIAEVESWDNQKNADDAEKGE